MIAKEILSPISRAASSVPVRSVEAQLPLLDVLPRLLDSPDRLLGVTEDGKPAGVIDSDSLLEGLGRLIASRDDCSTVSLECAPADYSASRIAHAVEDADAHLVDLLSAPAPEGKLRVTLRARCSDPTAVVRSLERYGYAICEVHGSQFADSATSDERLDALRIYLNV